LETCDTADRNVALRALDLIRFFLFKQKVGKIESLMKPISKSFRRMWRMKKLLFGTAVLLGAVAVSRAGIDIHIGLPLPPLPRVVIAPPLPVVVAPAPAMVYQAPVVYPAPVVPCPAPVVVVAPPVRGYRYAQRRGYYGYSGWAYARGHYCK
jgi:hypothetical protein